MPKVPEFTDYRVTNDGVMVADIGFKKQLWALDPDLDVVWDWSSEKWEIWRFPEKGERKRVAGPKAHHVMTIQTQDRSFRQVGADILLKLQEGDTTRYTMKELISYFDKMDENMQRAKRKELENKIGAITNSTQQYMRGVLQVQVPEKIKVERCLT